MNNNLKKYLQEKLKTAYEELNTTLKEYFILTTLRDKAKKDLKELELQMESECALFPNWEQLKHNSLTFDTYEEILALKIQTLHKQNEVLELIKKVLNKRVQVEENKRAVIDVKVDMHWIADDDQVY